MQRTFCVSRQRDKAALADVFRSLCMADGACERVREGVRTFASQWFNFPSVFWPEFAPKVTRRR